MKGNSNRPKGVVMAVFCAVPQYVELGFGDGEPVRCQSSCSAGVWRAWCSPDVVGSVVAHLATDDFLAASLRTGSVNRGIQRRDSVQQAVVLTVYQEAEMWEEVGPDEELCNVGQHEPPRELPV
jgi:hypothetical protein